MSGLREQPPRPAIRKDSDGVTSMAPTWESLTERLIREAQERGEFDGLPGHGRPLQLDDDPREGQMGLVFHLLRTARVAPPWIEADKDVRAALDERDRLLARARDIRLGGVPGRLVQQRLYQRLDQVIETHDGAVARLNATAPSLSLHRRLMDRAQERARLTGSIDGTGSAIPLTSPDGRA
jgi:Domain of unknown function (DUF1992)